MPISQLPAEKLDILTDKLELVGIPIAASTEIVSHTNLRLQPPGIEGEIAISGLTVMKYYLENPKANMKRFFYLTFAKEYQRTFSYFLTGDISKYSIRKLSHNIIITFLYALLRCNR